MTVYWEDAFLENALVDGVLLALAQRFARIRVRRGRLVLAASAGGAFAVLFPLIALPAWASLLVRALFGGALVLAAADARGVKPHLAALTFFFALTFALGGLLTALYSFFGIKSGDGTGFYMERAPVALIAVTVFAFAAAAFFLAGRLWHYQKTRQGMLPCVLTSGGRTVHWKGFSDSGNCLFFRGEPVCVVSALGILALLGAHPKAVGRIVVGTVNGSRTSPVFRCDALRVCGRVHRGVLLAVGETGKEVTIILHTALTEGTHEHLGSTHTLAQEHRNEQRRPLSLRERGAASAPSARGGGAPARADGGGGGGCQGAAHRT